MAKTRAEPFPPHRAVRSTRPCKPTDSLRGEFSLPVFGDDFTPLDQQCPAVVRKVSAAARAGATEFLEHANVDEYSSYPDIAGMADIFDGRGSSRALIVAKAVAHSLRRRARAVLAYHATA